MARIKYTTKELNTLARLIKAEAVGEGNKGMLLVGNVVVNRVVAKCSNFRNTNTLTKVIYQKNAFEGTKSKLFQTGFTSTQKKLAKRAVTSYRDHPATRSLFFYAPGKNRRCKNTFYGPYVGRYKNHCFYQIKNMSKCGL